MSIMDKIKKNSRIKEAAVLSEQKLLQDRLMVDTGVPMINVALSGSFDGGLEAGLLVLAGPSKHFKSNFALLLASQFLAENDDGVLIFYDNEFGSKESYFRSFGIDPERVWHVPLLNIENLKFDIVNQLEEMDRKDKVMIIIDSIGNIASKKEAEDAKNQKSVADMTRAKELKGAFRIITPYLAMKDIPMVVVNHTYKEMGLFPKDVVSGGTGIYYSADTIWIIGRQQNKKNNEIIGYNFVIREEKSRYVREGSKIPIAVTWEEGVNKYSGLLDFAVETGWVYKGKKGNSLGFSKMNYETGEVEEKVYYEKDTFNDDFWGDILANPKFKEQVEAHYKLGGTPMFHDDEVIKIEGEN